MALRVRRAFAAIDARELSRLRADGVAVEQAAWQLGLADVLTDLPQTLGRTFAALLIGSALVESVFYLPGLGRQILAAAEQHDLTLLRGGLLVLVLVATIGALLLALLRLLTDPAMRRELQR